MADKAARERAIKWAAAIVRAGKSPFVRRATPVEQARKRGEE